MIKRDMPSCKESKETMERKLWGMVETRCMNDDKDDTVNDENYTRISDENTKRVLSTTHGMKGMKTVSKTKESESGQDYAELEE